jgi:hypothetical protein
MPDRSPDRIASLVKISGELAPHLAPGLGLTTAELSHHFRVATGGPPVEWMLNDIHTMKPSSIQHTHNGPSNASAAAACRVRAMTAVCAPNAGDPVPIAHLSPVTVPLPAAAAVRRRHCDALRRMVTAPRGAIGRPAVLPATDARPVDDDKRGRGLSLGG